MPTASTILARCGGLLAMTREAIAESARRAARVLSDPAALRVEAPAMEWAEAQGDDATVVMGQAGPLYRIEPAADGAGGVAVVSIRGPIMGLAPDLLGWMLGEDSSERIVEAIDAAAADARVASLLLDVDCPGGAVKCFADISGAVTRCARAKRVVALARGMMASLGYIALCGADEIVASEEALLGSIGVVQVMYDDSGKLEKDGVRAIVVGSAQGKGAGMSGVPIDDETVEEMRRIVDASAARFIAYVAEQRGLEEASLRELGAGVLLGRDAVAAGLADRISTMADVLAQLTGQGQDTPLSGDDAMAEKNDEKMKDLEDQNAALASQVKALSEKLAAMEQEQEDEEPAALEALAAAFPGKDSRDFVFDCHEKRLTMAQARAAQLESLRARITESQAQIAQRDQDLAALQERFARLGGRGEARALSAPAAPSHKTYEEAVAALQAGGADRKKAMAEVARREAELHGRWLERGCPAF